MFSSQNLSYRNGRKVFSLADKCRYSADAHIRVRRTKSYILVANALIALVSLPLFRCAEVDVCCTSHIHFLFR